MAKIYFYYSAMKAGKSSQLIQNNYNYLERNMKTVVFKPFFDTRDSEVPEVVSRIGLRLPAIGLYDDFIDNIGILRKALTPTLDAVFIDEVQFLETITLENIARYCQDYGIPLMCYGLRNSFDGEGFPASDWLLRNADKLVEIKSLCWCGKKATHNAMVIDGVFQTKSQGSNMVLGDDIYVPLCFKHFNKEQLS